jgi:methionyl-tRNA synthetase
MASSISAISLGSMLPADVHARFRRLQGHEVLFICATDEHGTPAELAAAEAKLDVRAYCDEQHLLQRTCGEEFALSFDFFGRSSSRQNRDLTQFFSARLEDRGYIEEKETEQVYSQDDRLQHPGAGRGSMGRRYQGEAR